MAPTPPLSRRSVLALGGSAALGTLLAACSGDGQLVPATGDGSTASGTAGGPPPRIDQWYHQYGEEGVREAVERYAAEYEAADVTVGWQPGAYDRTTVTALAGGDGPDVFEYGNGPSIDMIRDGLVVDMTDVFGDALSDFTPSMIERMTYDGKIWAVPQVVDTQVLVYRPSLLEQVGIEPPRKMEDLQAAARELTTDKVKGLFLGNDGGARHLGGPMLWSAGLDFLDGDQVAFDSAGAAEALTVLRTFWTDEVLLLDSPEDWDDATALTSGRAAMQWTGLWTFPQIRAELGDDFGAIPWPSMPGGSLSVPVGAYGSCVSARAKDVEAAKDFARWLWVEKTEHQLDFATSYGVHIPARLSLVPEADVLTEGPARDVAASVLEHGHPQTPLLWTPRAQAAWAEMMGRVVREGAEPQAELDALVPLVEQELERVGG